VSDDHRELHELATVLDQFKETKSVAKTFLNDCNHQKKITAKEAVLKNTSRLIDAVTGCSFQGFVTGCAEKSLITPYYRNHLLHDTPMNKEALLIHEIEKVVQFQPSCLDTVLCILIDKCGIPGTVVAEAVANDYGYTLPNYESLFPVANAHHTYHPSIEDVHVKTTYSTAKMVVFGCIVLTLLITASTCIYMYMNYEGEM
jgi:hypothetical protein